MKKLFLLSVLVLSAMTMSAQIELIGTVNGQNPVVRFYMGKSNSNSNVQLFDCGKIAFANGDTLLSLYNTDLTLYKNIQLPEIAKPASGPTGTNGGFYCVSKNIFTTNNKVSFLHLSYNYELAVYDEDGNCVKEFTEEAEAFGVYLVDNSYYLFVTSNNITNIYSLPGKGQSTDLESPTAPARTSNARKVVENGQMYIILDGVKYAVTGTAL